MDETTGYWNHTEPCLWEHRYRECQKRANKEFAHRHHLERSLSMAHRLLARWMEWWDHADVLDSCDGDWGKGAECRDATDHYVRHYCQGKKALEE